MYILLMLTAIAGAEPRRLEGIVVDCDYDQKTFAFCSADKAFHEIIVRRETKGHDSICPGKRLELTVGQEVAGPVALQAKDLVHGFSPLGGTVPPLYLIAIGGAGLASTDRDIDRIVRTIDNGHLQVRRFVGNDPISLAEIPIGADVILYYSGHARVTPAGELELCITRDKSAPLSGLFEELRKRRPQSLGTILDACHAGAGVFETAVRNLAPASSYYWISSHKTQQSFAGRDGSDFTTAFCEGLSGDADDNSNGTVSAGELLTHIRRAAPSQSPDTNLPNESPVAISEPRRIAFRGVLEKAYGELGLDRGTELGGNRIRAGSDFTAMRSASESTGVINARYLNELREALGPYAERHAEKGIWTDEWRISSDDISDLSVESYVPGYPGAVFKVGQSPSLRPYAHLSKICPMFDSMDEAFAEQQSIAAVGYDPLAALRAIEAAERFDQEFRGVFDQRIRKREVMTHDGIYLYFRGLKRDVNDARDIVVRGALQKRPYGVRRATEILDSAVTLLAYMRREHLRFAQVDVDSFPAAWRVYGAIRRYYARVESLEAVIRIAEERLKENNAASRYVVSVPYTD